MSDVNDAAAAQEDLHGDDKGEAMPPNTELRDEAMKTLARGIAAAILSAMAERKVDFAEIDEVSDFRPGRSQFIVNRLVAGEAVPLLHLVAIGLALECEWVVRLRGDAEMDLF